MTERVREQLSAMVDNQLPEEEQELLVARLMGDRSLLDCWRRYHLIRDALRGQLPDSASPMLSDRVRDALRDEPLPRVGTHRSAPAWLKPLAGLAVAASVAMVAILAVRSVQEDTAPQMVAASEAVQQQLAAPKEVMRVRGTRWNVGTPRVAAQLNNYLVNHGEYAVSGMPAIGPHVRIVGYDTGR